MTANKDRRRVTQALLSLLLGASAGPGRAADPVYPSRPINLLVPLSAGSDTDILARILGERMGRLLGQPFIVDNKTGAGGQIATQALAAAKPDGYTLSFTFQAALTLIPHLKVKKPYDAVKDFAPVGLFATTGNALMVSATSPIKSLPELIARAKAEPGKMTFGSWGIGSGGHLMGEYLKTLTGIDIVHVPYRGTSESLLALLKGDIDMMFAGYGLATTQVQTGKVRALAVTAKQRGPTLPAVPTFSELGVPLAIDGWFGLIAPAGTPQDIVTKLNSALTAVLKQADLADRIAAMGMKLAPGSPADFGDLIQKDSQTWGAIVLDAKVPRE